MQHPSHRWLVSETLESFLLHCDHHGDSVTPMTREVGGFANILLNLVVITACMHTHTHTHTHNTHTASFLRLYHSLSQMYTNNLSSWGTGVARQLLLSSRATVTSLLHRLEGCHDNDGVLVRTQLQWLSCSDPSSTILGIRDYLTVSSFASGIYIYMYILLCVCVHECLHYCHPLAAVAQIEGGDWQSDRDWKTIFGTEVGSSASVRGLGLPQMLPLFEMTCRLLYREEPTELVRL